MEKKLTISIEGNEVVLNFGVNWFFEFYKNDSGHDLVKDPEMSLLDLGSIDLFKYLQSMVWAGYQANCKITKEPLKLTREQVQDLVMSGSEGDATDLAYSITAASYGITVEKLKELSEGGEKKNQGE
jgi:hypothetical protein